MSSEVDSCQHCGTEQKNFETKYFGGENELYEHILCTICSNLVTSAIISDSVCANDEEQKEDVSAVFGATCSDRECDRVSFIDLTKDELDVSDVTCEMDFADDVSHTGTQASYPVKRVRRLKYSCGAEEVKEDILSDIANTARHALAMGKRVRSLKHSCSSVEVKEKPTVADWMEQPATLDNGELSWDFLKQATQLYCQQLHCSCDNIGSRILHVEGQKNVFYCSGCLSVCGGVDDSVSFYDLVEELKNGNYSVEACAQCGNTDPELFIIEEGSSLDTIIIRCTRCTPNECRETDVEPQSNAGVLDKDSSMYDWIKEWIHYECKCKNSKPELQKIDIDIESSVVFVKCWVCQRENMFNLDFKPRLCSCPSGQDVDVTFDEYGFALKLVCSQCGAEMDCGASGVGDMAAGGDGMSCGRERITSLRDLKPGDHIAWHQLLGYWHHAIVTEVDDTQIRIVHYDGPDLPHKGKIVEGWRPVDASNEELYRINYKLSDCSHPKTVIERARSRIGERRYNILINNCEHFARWCKTGHKRSLQSESFFRSMLQRCATLLQSATVSGAKWLFASDQGKAALQYGAKVVRGTPSGQQLMSMAGSEAMKQAGPNMGFGSFAVPMLMITREVQVVCRDIRDAAEQRRGGQINRREFIKFTVKRTSEGCGAVAGVCVGFAIARNPVGCTLASIIGQGAGAMVGRSLSRLVDSKSKK